MSGYTLCPCCGYDTISNSMARPELCSDCKAAGCTRRGGNRKTGCPLLEELNEQRSADELD
jgi:hypothetical protein